jgi:carotenoid cleavage dioxygenase-like enzyme
MASAIEQLIRKTVATGAIRIASYNRKRLPAPEKPHPFLTGIHQPMELEVSLDRLEVRGMIPPGLDGRYVRIGPNPVKPPNPAAYHWFTGDGMVHGVRLKDGAALWYRNRWLRSNAVSAALGEAPAPGPRHARTDTVNTNVLGHAGKTWALVEAGGYPVEIGDDLETVAHNPFEGTLTGPFSAHPHLDPATGEMHAICYSGSDQNAIRHVVVGRDGGVRREEPIAVSHGPSVHDCALTASYVLVFDLPVTFSMKTLLAGHPFPYAWNPEHPARVGLLPREGRGSDILWCDVEPCYVFHPCNAFEAGDGRVIVDVVAHENMFAQSTQGPDSKIVKFERWTIDPRARRVERKVIDPVAQEFPRYDERRIGKPYRYAYTVPLARDDESFISVSHLIRHDLETGRRDIHEFGALRYPGEFVFVPAHPGSAEDEGWLMGYVINAAAQTTDLVIIDVRNFSGPPQAVIALPHRVPPGFHGNWIPVPPARS